MDIKRVAPAYAARVYAVDKPEKVKKTDSAAPAKVEGGEKVELSNTSAEIQKVQETIRKLPRVRIEIVEEIKNRIAKNDYPLENKLDGAIEKLMDLRLAFPY
jgi:anti-sigma28 factor (negative regulator of flagellin synthesis)